MHNALNWLRAAKEEVRKRRRKCREVGEKEDVPFAKAEVEEESCSLWLCANKP